MRLATPPHVRWYASIVHTSRMGANAPIACRRVCDDGDISVERGRILINGLQTVHKRHVASWRQITCHDVRSYHHLCAWRALDRRTDHSCTHKPSRHKDRIHVRDRNHGWFRHSRRVLDGGQGERVNLLGVGMHGGIGGWWCTCRRTERARSRACDENPERKWVCTLLLSPLCLHSHIHSRTHVVGQRQPLGILWKCADARRASLCPIDQLWRSVSARSSTFM